MNNCDASDTQFDESICGICKITQPKYKCPQCGIPYCSVGCYKAHKEICSGASQTNAQCIIERSHRQNEESDNCEDSGVANDITGTLISRESLEKIKDSENILELLREPYIQRAILKIVSSDNKEKCLDELRGNSELSILMDELLICVGVAKRGDDGTVEFIGV